MKYTIALILLLVTALPKVADAFCGFYVAGSGESLVNDATQVILMREGKRTVLSIQNSYKGPPENFAMVVPVPVVLGEDDVKTLPADIFAQVDRLASPRLVEYWEQDPCAPAPHPKSMRRRVAKSAAKRAGAGRKAAKDLGVTVEAEFKVGEYEIVILSAAFSAGLETWLRQEKYSIPKGAQEYLRPYVAAGSKFFVAKVDASKVKFSQGRAMLSPLRFHYESESFQLPVRLGLMNAQGPQDLIVHILAQGTRYEVANYPNVTIPTNLNVRNETRERFGEFYAALFDSTLERNPGAVVTEYSWSAASCDPCPSPPLTWAQLTTLGYDVIAPTLSSPVQQIAAPSSRRVRPRSPRVSGSPGQFVLTRLHARYSKDTLGEDLVFKTAGPIVGGRERRTEGRLEESAREGSVNNFQARYAIRHRWKGPVTCANPREGVWGGPPAGHKPAAQAATGLAFVARGGIDLTSMVQGGIPDWGQGPDGTIYGGGKAMSRDIVVPPARPATVLPPPDGKKNTSSESGCSTSGASSSWLALVLLWAYRRRRIS